MNTERWLNESRDKDTYSPSHVQLQKHKQAGLVHLRLCIHLRLQQWHILLWHWGWTCKAAVWLINWASWSVLSRPRNVYLLTSTYKICKNAGGLWTENVCRLYLHRITSLVISWAYTWQSRTTKKPWWWFGVEAARFLLRSRPQIWWVTGAHPRLNGFFTYMSYSLQKTFVKIADQKRKSFM